MGAISARTWIRPESSLRISCSRLLVSSRARSTARTRRESSIATSSRQTFTCATSAASSPPSDQVQKIESIQKQIEALQKQLEAVKKAEGTPETPSDGAWPLPESWVKSIAWRPIGPANMGGRIADVEGVPGNANIVYVATGSGGIFKTVNGGMTWTPIFDRQNTISVGDIALEPGNPDVIWAGTGEANSSRSSYSGLGVYKSTDNGKNWEYMGLPESHHIGKINLHPTDNNNAWVAVLGHLYSANKERGIYKTTDGGKTWKQTLYVDDNTGAADMDINQKTPDE